ncbi:hypothetical protein U1Q18_035793 [Sarracenia purpurea var. burkii]
MECAKHGHSPLSKDELGKIEDWLVNYRAIKSHKSNQECLKFLVDKCTRAEAKVEFVGVIQVTKKKVKVLDKMPQQVQKKIVDTAKVNNENGSD